MTTGDTRAFQGYLQVNRPNSTNRIRFDPLNRPHSNPNHRRNLANALARRQRFADCIASTGRDFRPSKDFAIRPRPRKTRPHSLLGSLHPRVFLRTIFPAERLDQLLNLEQRILAKIAMAAASIGVASPVDGAAHGQQVFTETREEIERLLKEDPALYERGGTASAAQTGEEYRQTLRKALAENRERIIAMPWKAGSGMAKDKDRGVLFCASVGDRTFLRFVPADQVWRPQGDDEAIISELGTCLRIIECEPQTPRVVPKELEEDRIFDLWAVAQSHIWRAWMIETDPANLQPKLRPLNRKAAEFIRANAPANIDAARITQALDVLESPWPRREEIMLREWFEDETRTGATQSAFLIDKILETGLEPFREPPTLAPIRTDEIELVCWMAILPNAHEP